MPGKTPNNKCPKGERLFAEVGDEVHGELVDLGVVVTLDLAEELNVALGDEVDGNSLTAVTTATTDTVEVVLLVGGEIVVDDDVDVVDVDTAGNEIGGDEDTGGAGLEGGHDLLALALGHLGVHGGDGVVVVVEGVSDVVNLAAGVGEDDGLGDGDGLVEIHEGVELVLLLDGDVELLDTLKGEGLALDENAGGLAHELGGHVEHVLGHGGGEESNLDVLGEELEDLVNLVGEALGEHLIGLIEDHAAEGVSAEGTAGDEVGDTAGGTDGDDDAGLDLADVILDTGTADEGVAEEVALGEVVAKGGDDVEGLGGELAGGGEDEGLEVLVAEVEAAEETDGEGAGLTGTRLGLGDDVAALDERGDGALLNGGGLLETVRVDTTEQVLVERHIIEGRDDLDVGLIVHEGIVILGLCACLGGHGQRLAWGIFV